MKWEYCEAVVEISSKDFIPTSVNIWKYKSDGKHETFHGKHLGQVIALLGQEGWELVSAYPAIVGSIIHNFRVTYVFKRPEEVHSEA